MRRGAFLGAVSVAMLVVGTRVPARDLPEGLPRLPFHLTARPWKPLDMPREEYLDAIEGVCRFTVRHQDARGAVIDAFLRREHQYSTPYFAFAVGTLIHAGRADDLLDHGVGGDGPRHASASPGAAPGIPDAHGEFFLASLPGALELYEGHVPAETIDRWRRRMGTPCGRGDQGRDEQLADLCDEGGVAAGEARAWSASEQAVAFIEDSLAPLHAARAASSTIAGTCTRIALTDPGVARGGGGRARESPRPDRATVTTGRPATRSGGASNGARR